MEYNGKKIMQENPLAAENYRQCYVDGIDSFIKRMKDESADKRRKFVSPDGICENIERYRREYVKMLGLDRLEGKASKPVEKVFVGSDEVADIFRLSVWITDEIPFYAMLFIPHGAKEAPLVITQHGGGGTPELCSDMNGKNNYNHMVQRVLEKGAVVIAPQLLLWSLEEIETQRKHNVVYDRKLLDLSLKRFGMSITALEIKGIMKCIDYGCALEEVCRDKVSMIGLSYGGYFTLHTMAADTRIKSAYTAGCFNDRNVYDWSDFSYPSSAEKFHDAEVAALCAPRKLYIQVGKEDEVFNYKTAVSEFERVKEYYKAFDCEENLKFSLWEGGRTFSDSNEGFDFVIA